MVYPILYTRFPVCPVLFVMLRVPTLESETMGNETSGFLNFKTKIICGTVVAEEEKNL